MYRLSLTGTPYSYAAKIIEKKTLISEKNRQMAQNEILIHKSMSHPNIVKYEHSFLSGNQVFILLELCDCSTLKDLVKRRRLNESQAKFYLRQILLAVIYMHDNGVIHRDLKIGNMFLTNNFTTLKIGDFGLSMAHDKPDPCASTIVGTPNYLAPEILNRGGYHKTGDIWSIGCCLYAMLYGKPPFDSPDVKTTYRNIKNRLFGFSSDVVVSHEARSLIDRCLSHDPMRRPTCNEILSDEFFKLSLPPSISPMSGNMSMMMGGSSASASSSGGSSSSTVHHHGNNQNHNSNSNGISRNSPPYGNGLLSPVDPRQLPSPTVSPLVRSMNSYAPSTANSNQNKLAKPNKMRRVMQPNTLQSYLLTQSPSPTNSNMMNDSVCVTVPPDSKNNQMCTPLLLSYVHSRFVDRLDTGDTSIVYHSRRRL